MSRVRLDNQCAKIERWGELAVGDCLTDDAGRAGDAPGKITRQAGQSDRDTVRMRSQHRVRWVANLALTAVIVLPSAVAAQIRVELFATGLSEPVAFAPDPLIDGVFYAAERGGLVRVIQHGASQPEPFADLRALMGRGAEQGLLGFAFAPDAASGRVYFNFIDVNGNTVISRFRRTATAPLSVDPASRFDLRWPTGERFIEQPFGEHNGGHLAFGPDGYLYIALGDGGGVFDPRNNAQDPRTLLGKMLRIDVAVPDDDPTGYVSPADNPFSAAEALTEIWAFGFRNPWRYSFDDFGSGATGALLVGDVGQESREEVSYEPRGQGGRNYGWRVREGFQLTAQVPRVTFGAVTDPILDYDHTLGGAVTAGFVYRGAALNPTYRGRYFYADFITSRVWSVGLDQNDAHTDASITDSLEHTGEFGTPLGGVVSFGRDRAGELYIVSYSGSIWKIVPGPVAAPQAVRDLMAVVQGTSLSVTWTAPSVGPVPSGYQLEAGSVPGASDVGVTHVNAAQHSLRFEGVPSGTYYLRVRAIGQGGIGSPVDDIIISVPRECQAAPPAPTALRFRLRERTVMLEWASPASSDGPAEFFVVAGSAPGASDLGVLGVHGTDPTVAVDAPPGQYFVHVIGRNACGIGAASEAILVIVF